MPPSQHEQGLRQKCRSLFDCRKTYRSLPLENAAALILILDKKKRDDLSVIAQTTSLGNITTSSLKHNLSQFKKEINSFKTNNKMSYQSRYTSDYDYLSAVENGDMKTAQRMVDETAKAAGYTADASDIRYQSRDDDFDLDFLFDDDDSIESTFAKEYATHHEDIGEVLILILNKNLYHLLR